MRSAAVATMQAATAAIAIVAAAGAGCDRDHPGDRAAARDLPGLVTTVVRTEPPIDVEAAVRDVTELVRAGAVTLRLIGERLGPHRLAVTASTEVREGATTVETLRERANVDLDGEGFHAVHVNSRDYGREAYFVDGELFLRPRFGRLHMRRPIDDGEPGRIRDEIAGSLAATLTLCAPGLAVEDGGARQVAGRAARVVKLGAGRGPAPAELPPHQAWRRDATIEDARGEVALDAATGAPLTAELSCRVGYARDGRRFTMVRAVTHTVSAIGAVVAIEAPPDEAIAGLREPPRELEERERLLEGIAPPAARSRTPANPTGAPSATGRR